MKPWKGATRAVPGDARRHNRALVLQALFREGPLSRADLARETQVTRVTASDLVSELLADGLVEELGTRTEQRVGKPATLVGIVPDARLIAAADLSDDKRFQVALVDLTGNVIERRHAEHGGRTGQDAMDLVGQLLAEVLELAERPLLGIGVGTPGVVDPKGVVLEAPKLGWHDRDLADNFRTRFNTEAAHVANDANAAVLSELSLGGPPGRSLLLAKIGHGVGAGVVIDGHLVVGDRFAAGEIGHVVVDPDGEECVCGRTGCLEAAIAAPLLRRRIAEGEASEAAVARLAGGTVSEEAVGSGAKAQTLAGAGEMLGRALAPVVSALNLREVVLSGPRDLLDDTFRRAALDAVQSRTMPAVGDNVDLRLSASGEDDVLLGAAMLVLDRELGVA